MWVKCPAMRPDLHWSPPHPVLPTSRTRTTRHVYTSRLLCTAGMTGCQGEAACMPCRLQPQAGVDLPGPHTTTGGSGWPHPSGCCRAAAPWVHSRCLKNHRGPPKQQQQPAAALYGIQGVLSSPTMIHMPKTDKHRKTARLCPGNCHCSQGVCPRGHMAPTTHTHTRP